MISRLKGSLKHTLMSPPFTYVDEEAKDRLFDLLHPHEPSPFRRPVLPLALLASGVYVRRGK